MIYFNTLSITGHISCVLGKTLKNKAVYIRLKYKTHKNFIFRYIQPLNIILYLININTKTIFS